MFADSCPGPDLWSVVMLVSSFSFFVEGFLGLQHITHITHRRQRVSAKGELLQWCRRSEN